MSVWNGYGGIPQGYGLPYDQVYGYGRLSPSFVPTSSSSYGVVEPISATIALIGGVVVPGAITGVKLAQLKSAKNQALRESNACIAKIDGEIQALRNAKAKGRRKKIKALMKQRKLLAKNPAMCKLPAAAQAIAAETMAVSEAELSAVSGQTEAMAVAEGSASPLPWIAGGTLAVLVVGAVAFAASRSRR